jgi:hypothetical protein
MSNITPFPMNEQTQPEQNDITIGDFILIQNIIGVAAKRGAFESNEFTVIGALTDRLNAFIKAHTPPAESTEVDEDGGQLELPLETPVNP